MWYIELLQDIVIVLWDRAEWCNIVSGILDFLEEFTKGVWLDYLSSSFGLVSPDDRMRCSWCLSQVCLWLDWAAAEGAVMSFSKGNTCTWSSSFALVTLALNLQHLHFFVINLYLDLLVIRTLALVSQQATLALVTIALLGHQVTLATLALELGGHHLQHLHL